MKATGIVRRIDDLGRVVIPKEIRRTMRIREGDPLEIYTSSNGEVVFKKYSPMGEVLENAGQYAEVLSRMAGLPTAAAPSARPRWRGRSGPPLSAALSFLRAMSPAASSSFPAVRRPLPPKCNPNWRRPPQPF